MKKCKVILNNTLPIDGSFAVCYDYDPNYGTVIIGTLPAQFPQLTDMPRWVVLAHEYGHTFMGHFNLFIKPHHVVAMREVEAWDWAVERQTEMGRQRVLVQWATECLNISGVEGTFVPRSWAL